MKPKNIARPRCQGQPCYLENTGIEPIQAGTYTLKKGQRACHGRKHWYMFTDRDPRGSVPSWCPRLRCRPIWRIYTYAPDYQRVYEEHYCGVKALDSPMEKWYTLRHEGDTCLSARDFWCEVCQSHMSVNLLLDTDPMEAGQLLVINDGVVPKAFYMADTGLRPVEIDMEALPEKEQP